MIEPLVTRSVVDAGRSACRAEPHGRHATAAGDRIALWANNTPYDVNTHPAARKIPQRAGIECRPSRHRRCHANKKPTRPENAPTPGQFPSRLHPAKSANKTSCAVRTPLLAQQAPWNSAPTPCNSQVPNVAQRAPAGAARTKSPCALKPPQHPMSSARALECWEANGSDQATPAPRKIREENLMRREDAAARPGGPCNSQEPNIVQPPTPPQNPRTTPHAT